MSDELEIVVANETKVVLTEQNTTDIVVASNTESIVAETVDREIVATDGSDVVVETDTDTVIIVDGGGGSGVTDHGLLLGLSDDDHAQYILGDRVSWTDLTDGGNTTLHTHDIYLTQAEGDALYSVLAHTHDHGTLTGLGDDDHTQYILGDRASWTDLTDSGDTTLHFHSADRARANHTGTQLAATISDFSEAVDDRVAALLVEGAGIDLSYDDAGNALTITVDLSEVDHGSLAGLSDDDHTQYHTDTRALTWLGTRSTSDLAEGTNLYFTNERVDDRIAALFVDGTGIDSSYDDVNGTFTVTVDLSELSTSTLPEGSNLYYTDERVDDRVAALLVEGTGIDLAYVDASGTLTITVDLSELSTSTLPEGSNLYYTDERVDDRVATLLQNGGGLTWTYNDGAGTLTPAIDHGGLGGLGDNDHPQYLLAASYTAADVLAKLLTVDGSGSGLDADLLDGISSGSFLRADASQDRLTGHVTRFVGVSGETLNGISGERNLVVFNPGNNTGDAFMTFHNSNNYAAYFGLGGAEDDLIWGGWSAGAVRYRIWHSGNDGSGSGLDADLFDGLNSTRFVYGDNTTKTTNNNNWNATLSSGFYDQDGGAGSTTGTPTESWYHGIFARHTNETNNYQLQIAGNFFDVNHFYVRQISDNTPGAWKKIWHEGNDGAGSGLDADLLDGKNTGTSGNTVPLLDGANTWSNVQEFGNGLNARKSTSGEFYALTLANNSGSNGSSCVIDIDATGAGQDVRSAQIAVVNDSGSTGYYFVIRTGAGEPGVNRLKIDDGGLVTILSTFQVDGTALFSSSVLMESSGSSVLDVAQTSSTSYSLGSVGQHNSYASQIIRSDCYRGGNVNYSFLLAASDIDGTPDTEFNLQGNGTALADGSFTGSGADYQEYFESTDGTALPVGRTVVLDGDKVRLFAIGDDERDIIGVVRPKEDNKNSAVVGNAAWNHWTDKYLTDDYGRYVQEDYTVYEWVEDGEVVSYADYKMPRGVVPPRTAKKTVQQKRKLNPDWVPTGSRENPIGTYKPRHDRPEWNLIGLLGQVQIEVGQPVNPRWVHMKSISSDVDLWFIR